jgi:hypothetical protein
MLHLFITLLLYGLEGEIYTSSEDTQSCLIVVLRGDKRWQKVLLADLMSEKNTSE